MKKIFTLSIALTLGASVYADNVVTILGCGKGTPGVDEPQLMGLGISPNGRYVCGAIESGVGIFVADVQSGEVQWAMAGDEGGELRHVDNNGVAVGFTDLGIKFDMVSGMETVLEAPKNYRYVLCEDITEDGSLIVGSLAGQSFETKGAYTTDGVEWNILPIPSKTELGDFAPGSGSAAKYVSADGNVIFGYLGSFTIPIVWFKNDKGEYEPDFFPARFMKAGDSDIDNEAKPLYSISAMYLNMSNNGKYLSMLGMVYDKELGDYLNVPVIYDTESRDIIIYKERQVIDDYNAGLYPTAICDDGTFIGTVGQPFFGASGCFIMKAGQTSAEMYNTAFPAFADKLGDSDIHGFNIPTGMSADGNYIMGYTYYCDDYYDANADAYYVTYVIDVKANASVDAVHSDTTVATPEAYYSIDGRRLNTMTKGLNIVRMSDGTARKVIVR